METLIIGFPMLPEHVRVIHDLLYKHDVFLTNANNSDDPYNIYDYLPSGVKVWGHLDRNILSRAIDLSKGQSVPDNTASAEMYRTAAACWAFIGALGGRFAPGIAIFELSDTQGSDSALVEYADFKFAKEIDPNEYAKIAAGEIESIHYREEDRHLVDSTGTNKEELEKPPRYWKASYLVLLKIAELVRSPISGEERVLSLVQWMVDESVFDALGVVLGVLGFSSNPPKGVLSGIRTPNNDRLFKKLKNMAWDATHIRNWAKSCNEAEIRLFCTLDIGLKELARSAFRFNGEESTVSDCDELFGRYWPNSSEVLITGVREQERITDSEERTTIVQARRKSVDDDIATLEERLRSMGNL